MLVDHLVNRSKLEQVLRDVLSLQSVSTQVFSIRLHLDKSSLDVSVEQVAYNRLEFLGRLVGAVLPR